MSRKRKAPETGTADADVQAAEEKAADNAPEAAGINYTRFLQAQELTAMEKGLLENRKGEFHTKEGWLRILAEIKGKKL